MVQSGEAAAVLLIKGAALLDAVLARARAWGLMRALSFAFRSMGALGCAPADALPLLPPAAREALEAVRPCAGGSWRAGRAI